MPRLADTLARWARRTSTSFSELLSETPAETMPPATGAEPIYRLRQWPSLSPSLRTADVLRLLSRMGTRPVNRSWMLNHSGLEARRVDLLLRQLRAQDALEVIDPSAFASESYAPR
ncbi:MAG TPA: hypothetical protein VFE82_11180 [Ramlibacter sp.]|jgi:hypothetical protein|uniref:hypothetical protein n=1 Tax=Ramlibacter sp. TaxID=1917967 RepID=UPI002D59E340|nr:hypothetical protein [Ramlibacter sp.]HZY19036.1 hypothetical protein [Ramlibacter sp.]